MLSLPSVRAEVESGTPITLLVDGEPIEVRHRLSERQVEAVLRGGVLNVVKARLDTT